MAVVADFMPLSPSLLCGQWAARGWERSGHGHQKPEVTSLPAGRGQDADWSGAGLGCRAQLGPAWPSPVQPGRGL